MKYIFLLLLPQLLLYSQEIIQTPIKFSDHRIELTKSYIKAHYGIESENIKITPKIILIHHTAINSYEDSLSRFMEEELPSLRADISSAGAVNVSTHFMIERDGKIHQLMPLELMGRHVIGLNYSSIGIENVGGEDGADNLTDAQLRANIFLIDYLKNKFDSIEYLVGHYEYRCFENSELWLEKDDGYRTEKNDPHPNFMEKLSLSFPSLKRALVITEPLTYLLVLAVIATFLSGLEQKTKWNFFKFVPAVVLIYATTMIFASFGVWELNKDINDVYKLAKTNLLPAMIFLMLLQVDVREFFKLGKKLIIAYSLAVLSIAFGFIVVSIILGFDKDMLGAFGALAGSWMGGTANMVAVGSALGVSDEAFGYALIVDSFNYTFWVAFLLFIVGFANIFNRFINVESSEEIIGAIGCSCNMGAKRYWSLVAISLIISFISQVVSHNISIINSTTTTVIVATLAGILASFTKLRELNGSDEIANSMLYMLIALIGSRAVFDSFDGIGFYIFGGFLILVIHALVMVIGAKVFRLDLFSICVASLSNIGGVASAPILAAAYNKSLVGVGVLMAIMGYIIGTFGGLFVGNIILGFAG